MEPKNGQTLEESVCVVSVNASFEVGCSDLRKEVEMMGNDD